MGSLKTIGPSTTLSIPASGSVSTSALPHYSDSIRVAPGVGCKVEINSSVTAPSADAMVVLPIEIEIFSIGAPQSNRIVGYTKGTTTLIDFPEGTGSPFSVGDLVMVMGQQTAFNSTACQVLNVYTSADVGGFFSTRIEINFNSSSIVPTFDPNIWTELRSAFYVNAQNLDGSSTGDIYVQQVQRS